MPTVNLLDCLWGVISLESALKCEHYLNRWKMKNGRYEYNEIKRVETRDKLFAENYTIALFYTVS